MPGKESAFVNRSYRCGNARIGEGGTDNAAGPVVPKLSRNRSPDEPIAELLTVLFDNHQIRQQLGNIGRVEITPRRHSAGAPPGEPIVVENEVMRNGNSQRHRGTIAGL